VALKKQAVDKVFFVTYFV